MLEYKKLTTNIEEYSTHLQILDALGNKMLGIVACNFKKFPTITQDLTMEMHRYEGKSVSTYPCRPLAQASSDAVDVVEQLRDPPIKCRTYGTSEF